MRLSKIKFFVIVGFLFLLSNNSFSQTILLDPPEIYLGGSFGANASMLNFNPHVEQIPQLGYVGGLTFRYVNEKHFGLQIEANYSQRGWGEKTGNYARRLDYFEVPFLSHFYVGNTHRFIFNIGIKASMLNKDVVVKNEVATDLLAEQHTFPAKFKFDYGAELGLGYNLKTKRAGVFQLELRGYYSLGDVFPNRKGDYFDTSNHINAGVRVGWLFLVTCKEKR